MTKCCWISEIRAMHMCAHVVELEKCCNIEVRLANIGFDRAEKIPSKVVSSSEYCVLYYYYSTTPFSAAL